MTNKTKYEIPPLTEEQRARGRAALEAARRIIEADRAAGRIFPPAGEIVDEIRAEAEARWDDEC